MRNIKYLLLVCIVLLITCCKKETPEISKPWIDRGEYNPETRTATSKMTGGDSYIVERGHAWGINPSPTPENSFSEAYENAENTVDTVTIITEITDIIPDEINFFRAYAIDKFDNIFYGEQDIIFDPSTYTNTCFSISNDECEISECFIDFDATCSENVVEYRWDFNGDGTFELVGNDKQAVSNEYTEAGAYEVKLQTVSPEGIVDDMVQTVQTFAVGGALVPCFTTSTTEAELDEVVYFDAFCTENAVNYQWDLDGDGTFEVSGSDQQLVNHPYTEIGTYNPTLRVENEHGIVETTTTTITVSQAISIDPIACFSTNTAVEEVNQIIYLDASCSEYVDNYKWDLDGDGVFEITGSDQSIINHTYTEIGMYDITLEVENIHGITDVMAITVEITEANSIAPVACFSTNTTAVGIAETIYFDASCSENVAEYKWDLDGDGVFEISSSNMDVISHTYDESGTYMPKLQIKNIAGTIDEITQTITVNPPKFRITLHRMFCERVGDVDVFGVDKDEYFGYTLIHLHIDGSNQAAIAGSEVPLGDVLGSNQYRMWERGSSNTIQLEEGEAYSFNEWLEYEVNTVNINTAQMVIYSWIKEDDLGENDFIGDREEIIYLNDLEVNSILNITQSISGADSTVEMDITIRRTQ